MQLNVTNQAVSKWENGDCMPDISQVVPLTNVFGVTTDVLFGKDGTDGDEEVTMFIREAERKISNKPAAGMSRFTHRKECCEEVQAMLATYPNHFALLCCSLNFIVFLLWDYTKEQFTDEITDKESEMKVWENEGIRQGNIVLNHCTDSYLLNIANRCLVSIYRIMKDYAKAEEHAKKLTDDREKYLAIVYDDMGRPEDAMKQYSIGIHDCFHKLTQILPLLGYLYRKQQKFDEAYTCRVRLFLLRTGIIWRLHINTRADNSFYAVCSCIFTSLDIYSSINASNASQNRLRYAAISARSADTVISKMSTPRPSVRPTMSAQRISFSAHRL